MAKKKQVNVTSVFQSGGITAGTVNIGSEPEIKCDVLATNVKHEGRYGSQARLTVVAAHAGARLRVEAVCGSPIDLELMAENAAIIVESGELVEGPGHKAIEMGVPLAPSYIATIWTAEPLDEADLKWQFL
jgi:hypothetical protein